MRRLTLISALFTGGMEALACSPGGFSTYRYDTLETGALRMLQIQDMGSPQNPDIRIDTLGVYHPADLEAKLRASLQDSSLVFVARFDSLWTDLTNEPSPLIALDPQASHWMHPAIFRLKIDTVLRGVFPHPNPVWIRVRAGAGSCEVYLPSYLNRPFLNVSGGFETQADLKMYFSPFPEFYGPYPTATWFNGRYLTHMDFPAVMKLDITRILSDYPVTSLTPRRLPGRAPALPAGKAWLPNGREAKGPDARGNPVPVLK